MGDGDGRGMMKMFLLNSLIIILFILFLMVQSTTKIAWFDDFFPFSFVESCSPAFGDAFANFVDVFITI